MGKAATKAASTNRRQPISTGRHPRALITPHVAFYSREAGVELQERATDEILRALGGREPRRPVNAAGLAAA